MIRVLIAEDSATVCEMLVAILSADPEIAIAGVAKDGREAVELAKSLRPDVITMDILMPHLDGFEATKRIMVEAPTPIVIISAVVDADAVEISMRALGLGALAVVGKPVVTTSPAFEQVCRHLVATVKAMAKVRVVRRWADRSPAARDPAADHALPRRRYKMIAIAASTGGPAALHRLFGDLPANLRLPILVVQHMADGFVDGFAEWLNAASGLRIKVAEDGEPVQPNSVYVAPDDRHLGVSRRYEIFLSSAGAIDGFRPSGSFLFESIAKTYGSTALSIILTGMGRDGVEGLKAVRAAGGTVLAQDEASSTVFGMPGAAIAAGVADAILPLGAIASHVANLVAG